MTRTPRILVTGFGPFPGAPENPTEWLVAELTRQAGHPDYDLVSAVLPVDYALAGPALDAAAAEARPDIAIHFGLAAGAAGFRLERLASHHQDHSLPDNAGRGGIGTPEQVEAHLRGYEDIGLDQIIFVQQVGRNAHEHICETLETFADTLLPAFKEREDKRQKAKQAELAPYIEAALARKERMADLPRDQIPTVKAAGKRRIESGEVDPTGGAFVDKTRGGAIPIPHADPRANPQAAAKAK